jgi:hypothetical protein
MGLTNAVWLRADANYNVILSDDTEPVSDGNDRYIILNEI